MSHYQYTQDKTVHWKKRPINTPTNHQTPTDPCMYSPILTLTTCVCASLRHIDLYIFPLSHHNRCLCWFSPHRIRTHRTEVTRDWQKPWVARLKCERTEEREWKSHTWQTKFCRRRLNIILYYNMILEEESGELWGKKGREWDKDMQEVPNWDQADQQCKLVFPVQVLRCRSHFPSS